MNTKIIAAVLILTLAGCTSAPVGNSEPLTPAAPIELSTAGKVMTEQEFYGYARRAFFSADWVVISAENGAVTAKKNAARFFSGGHIPVNDRLQWNEERKAYAFRAEIRLVGNKIVFSYLPNWGSTSDEPLQNVRKAMALTIY